MPVMDGIAATRHIRELEAAEGRGPAYIVALTAHTAPEDRQEALAAGMDEVLNKPVSVAVRASPTRMDVRRVRLCDMNRPPFMCGA